MSNTYQYSDKLDPQKSGWYKYRGEDNSTLRVTDSNMELPGTIRLNNNSGNPTFQGYDGSKWCEFNAMKGEKGDKGDNFDKNVILHNLPGGEGTLFHSEKSEINSDGKSVIPIKSITGGETLLNGELIANMKINNTENNIVLEPVSLPHMWDFVENKINCLKSVPSDNDILKAYGDVSRWEVKSGCHVESGQAVRTINQDGKLVVEPFTYRGIPNPFRENMSFLGIALQNVSGGNKCLVCTRGITSVKISTNVGDHFMSDSRIEFVGQPGLIGEDGFIFNSKVKPSVDYFKAGNFQETGSDGDYRLFKVGS